MSNTIIETICPIGCVKAGCDDTPDYLEKHSTFFLTLVGSVSALVGILLSYCIKSRCKNIKCCCISCDREPIDLNNDNIQINNIS